MPLFPIHEHFPAIHVFSNPSCNRKRMISSSPSPGTTFLFIILNSQKIGIPIQWASLRTEPPLLLKIQGRFK